MPPDDPNQTKNWTGFDCTILNLYTSRISCLVHCSNCFHLWLGQRLIVKIDYRFSAATFLKRAFIIRNMLCTFFAKLIFQYFQVICRCHRVSWRALKKGLHHLNPLHKDCVETNVLLYMTFVRPFLAIFLPNVCSSFTKLRFIWSIWGA